MKKTILISMMTASLLMAADNPAGEISEAEDEIREAELVITKAKAKIKMAEATMGIKPEADEGLKTKTELSYIDTSGNTDTTSFALEFIGDYKWDKNTVSLLVEVLNSSSGGHEDKNKWKSVLQYDRDITENLYVNYVAAYEEDRFSGYDYKFNTGPGLGYKVLENDAHKLTTQANVLYSKDKLEDNRINEYASWLAGFEYDWKILDNLKFIQRAWYKSDIEESENYFAYSKTAFESKINSIFSMGVSYKIDYANQVPSDKVRTDKTLLVSLIIDY